MILKLRQRLRKKSAQGFTLTELAIVLGITGIISAAIWYASSNAHEAEKQSAALVELQTVAQNIANIYSGRSIPGAGTPTTLLTDAMIRGKEIPSVYVNALSLTTGVMLADNPWYPTGFVVYSGTSPTNAASQYHISFLNVTRGGCLALLSRGTACHYGQIGCPTAVATNCPAGACTEANTMSAGPGADWPSIMTLSSGDPAAITATSLCGQNAYPGVGTTNSVDFFYSL